MGRIFRRLLATLQQDSFGLALRLKSADDIVLTKVHVHKSNVMGHKHWWLQTPYDSSPLVSKLRVTRTTVKESWILAAGNKVLQ